MSFVVICFGKFRWNSWGVARYGGRFFYFSKTTKSHKKKEGESREEGPPDMQRVTDSASPQKVKKNIIQRKAWKRKPSFGLIRIFPSKKRSICGGEGRNNWSTEMLNRYVGGGFREEDSLTFLPLKRIQKR